MPGVLVELQALAKRFGAVRALDRVSLRVEPEEFVTLLGPSGCGKSTLLKIIAGFVTPDDGEVVIDGRPAGRVPPHRRGVGIVCCPSGCGR